MARVAFRALLGVALRRAPQVSRRERLKQPAGGRRTALRLAESNASGLAIEGFRYLVWDEDPRQARQWALELRAAQGPARRHR